MSALEKVRVPLRQFFDKEFVAELLSTFLLILLGDGAVSQWTLLNLDNPKSEPFLSVNFGFGAGVAFGAYLAAGISGAHMNPAVSISLAVVGKFPWKKIPKYIVAQMLGAFIGAMLVFFVYSERLSIGFESMGDTSKQYRDYHSRGILATYPHGNTSTGVQMLDQIVGTMILLLIICSLTDQKNSPPPPGITPLCVGGSVFAIGVSFGTNCGYAINPARDFPPRLASLIIGNEDAFSASNYYFWIPVVCPVIGAIIGTCLYTYILEISISQCCIPGTTTLILNENNHAEGSNNESLELADDIGVAGEDELTEIKA